MFFTNYILGVFIGYFFRSNSLSLNVFFLNGGILGLVMIIGKLWVLFLFGFVIMLGIDFWVFLMISEIVWLFC